MEREMSEVDETQSRVRNPLSASAAGGNGNGGHLAEVEQAFVDRWHDNAYGCFSSGHKFCREVCPVTQVTRNENHTPTAFRQQRVGNLDRGFARSRQFASETRDRRFDTPRTLNDRQNGLTRNGNNGRFENRGANGAREHVFARRSADWHRDWDRHHDHWWHGHRCRFVNGSWFIYDIGFDPYDYWYPYEDYAYAYYPYEYNAGVYEGDGADYYDQGGYDSSGQSADSTIAAAQEQLAKQGYYRGEIDGIFGPETSRAIVRFQGNHGLRVTGTLNMDTLHALGLPRASNN